MEDNEKPVRNNGKNMEDNRGINMKDNEKTVRRIGG